MWNFVSFKFLIQSLHYIKPKSFDSVKNNGFYHNQLKQVVKEYYKDGDEFYLWSNEIEKIDYVKLQLFMNSPKRRKV